MNFLPPVVICGIFWAVLSVIRQSAKTKSKLSGVLALINNGSTKEMACFHWDCFCFQILEKIIKISGKP